MGPSKSMEPYQSRPSSALFGVVMMWAYYWVAVKELN